MGCLPLLGFHPDTVAVVLIIHGTYAFLTHTELLPKWKIIELVFITPSLHAVHHASNEKYLNKNYGDIFVFWDKLFNTYQSENEKPIYGLTKPLKSKSYLWQHFHYYLELLYAFKAEIKFSDKIKLLFNNPDLHNNNIRDVLEKRFKINNFTPNSLHKSLIEYVCFQLLLSIVTLFFTTLFIKSISWIYLSLISIIIITTLLNCCALIEHQKHVLLPEYIRVFFLHILVSHYLFNIQYFLSVGILLIAILVTLPLKNWYFQKLFKKEIKSFHIS